MDLDLDLRSPFTSALRSDRKYDELVEEEDDEGGRIVPEQLQLLPLTPLPHEHTHTPIFTAIDMTERERERERERCMSMNMSRNKKLRLTKEQSALLEESFRNHPTLNPKQKMELASRLKLSHRQVEVWFQNRRARTKLKQTEMECEYLKRCSEALKEENVRLKKEVAQLRALKVECPYYLRAPASTVTMCPSCEKIISSPFVSRNNNSSSSSSSAANSVPGTPTRQSLLSSPN